MPSPLTVSIEDLIGTGGFAAGVPRRVTPVPNPNAADGEDGTSTAVIKTQPLVGSVDGIPVTYVPNSNAADGQGVPITPVMSCPWYAADGSTAEGPSDYLVYDGFTAALAATTGFTQPDLVWGSVSAYWNGDGSAPYVDIILNPPGPPPSEFAWAWTIGIVGNADADIGGANTAQLALAGAQASAFLPAGFCPAPTPSTGISWDPPSAGGSYATGGIATPGPVTPFADLAAFQALDQSTITLLYLPSAGINSITGLNTLPNLQTLCLTDNNLTGVNLSGCTALVNFYCNENALTSLDVSTNDNLLNLFAGSNQLTVSSVNTILSTLVSNGQTGGNVDVSAQAPAAPPSHGPPDGIAAEATLLGETPAWTVSTD